MEYFKCGNTGGGGRGGSQTIATGEGGDERSEEVLSFICENMEHIYIIIMIGSLKIHQ